jgi:hypothetical protein
MTSTPWQDMIKEIKATSPEALDQFRQHERERMKKLYHEQLGVKTMCPICLKEVSTGWLAQHQQSSSCKPVGVGSVFRQLTDKDLKRREAKREYVRQWRERKKEQEQQNQATQQ